MKSRFTGFPAEALEFFGALEHNNNRDWFQPRKARFEEIVRAPMLEMISAINTELAGFAPDFTTEPKKAIYRIYRDTRFSPNKTPYKDHVAALFTRRGLGKTGGGGFYFSVNHKTVDVAGGMYEPQPDTLLQIRSHLAETHVEFRKLIAARKLRNVMGEMRGAELSRVPKGFPSDHPAADLLRKKQWIFSTNLDPDLATSPELLAAIVARFKVLKPFLDHLDAPLLAKKAARPTTYLPSTHF